jgi:hypothetical protein
VGEEIDLFFTRNGLMFCILLIFVKCEEKFAVSEPWEREAIYERRERR